MESGRATVWHFNALFHADGDRRAKACLDTTHGVCKFGMVRHLLKTHLMTNERPACISYIELRFLRSDVAVCVALASAKTTLSDIPFEGFIQSSNRLTRTNLTNWFNAAWTPVIGKLSECEIYSVNFCERNDAYEYSLVHGKPAVGRGGRPPKVKSPIPIPE